MHQVVVVGAGFAGLSAARTLIGKPVEVTIVDQRNFHTFHPLLYEVATAGLESGDVAYPIRVIFGKAKNVSFRMGRVIGVGWDRREVLLDGDHSLPFDSLIVASGATAKFFGIPGPPTTASRSTRSPTPGACGTTSCGASRTSTPTPPGRTPTAH
jgi:NADH dehydrogenase